MEITIEETYANQTPEQRKEFQKLLRNKIPSPEEFIYKVAKKLEKRFMYCMCQKAGTTQGGHAARHV